MATHLDLQEQEQLDQIKHFWKQYGNLITVLLVIVLGGYAAWMGWNRWQGSQSQQAGAMFDELDRAVSANQPERVASIFNDLKERYPRTAFAQQGGLLAAKAQLDAGKQDAAAGALEWVAGQATETEYRAVAHLRLAALLMEQKKFDEAAKHLDGVSAPEFKALVADRRGDILIAQGKTEEAKASYRAAWDAMDARLDYRRLVEAKLTALGAAPPAELPASGAAR